MATYKFTCPKCPNWVELQDRKGGNPPFTPSCNNHEGHHHPRAELMTLAGITQPKKRGA